MVIEVVQLRKLGDGLELQLVILLSLTCQIILMLLGNRRRYTKSHLLQITLWSAYFAADSLAVFALGEISCDVKDDAQRTRPLDASQELKAFLAPFLLLHLGGVDTITAYSPEDDELWSRQLLDFVVQTGLVILVFLRAWSGPLSYLSILSILMFVAGIINYGLLTYALWRASYKQRKARVSIGRIHDSNYQQFDEKQRHVIATSILTECLFADVPQEIWVGPLRHVLSKSCTTEVEHVELGLALMYDSLYTRAKVSHSAWGAAMRCICFLLTCISSVLFCVLNKQTAHYSKINLQITFAFLTMAIVKELHGVFVVLTSYTTLFWFTCFTASKTNVIFDLTLALLKRISAVSWLGYPKWSNSMGQCSLLSYFLNGEPWGRQGILKFLSLSTQWKKEEKLYGTCHVVPVLDDMKQWMYDIYLNRIGVSGHLQDYHLGDIKSLNTEYLWSRVLVWHLVTEICYCLDHKKKFSNHKYMMYSNYISRYMMYLVVMTPDMFSSGWEYSQQRFSDLLTDVQKLCSATVTEWSYDELEQEEAIDETQTSKKTREVRIRACGNFEDVYNRIIGTESSNSEILQKCARLLEALKPATGETEENETKLQDRWEVLSEVWKGLLSDAATKCKSNQHAQFLSEGGELLTYAWVLRALEELNSAPDALEI